MRIRTIFLTLGLVLFGLSAHAEVPGILNYQGRVTAGGTNFDGTGQFMFALVNGTGTTNYWSNDGTAVGQPAAAVSVTVTKGLYSVLLGDTSLVNQVSIPSTVFLHDDVSLRVWFDDGVNGSQQLMPDQRIAAAGYALNAANGWSLAGNAGTSPTNGQFIGTTDNEPLELRVNNSRALSIQPGSTASIIGGFTSNSVGAGVSGAFLGGGGFSGAENIVNANFGVLGGGAHNQTGDDTPANRGFSTVSGGFFNKADGDQAAIGGGYGNRAGGTSATVPGGEENSALGDFSLAAGRKAKAVNQGAFVWADSTDADFGSTANDQFLVRAAGGVGIGTNNPVSALQVNGTVTATAFSGDGSGLTGITATNFTVSLAGDVTGPQGTTVVGTVGGVSAAAVASGVTAAYNATSENTADTIVKRDTNGNINVETVTGNLAGIAEASRYTVEDTSVTNLHLINSVNIGDTGVDGWNGGFLSTIQDSNGLFLVGIVNILDNTNQDGADGVVWWTKYGPERHGTNNWPRWSIALSSDGQELDFSLINAGLSATNNMDGGIYGTNGGAWLLVNTNTDGYVTEAFNYSVIPGQNAAANFGPPRGRELYSAFFAGDVAIAGVIRNTGFMEYGTDSTGTNFMILDPYHNQPGPTNIVFEPLGGNGTFGGNLVVGNTVTAAIVTASGTITAGTYAGVGGVSHFAGVVDFPAGVTGDASGFTNVQTSSSPRFNNLTTTGEVTLSSRIVLGYYWLTNASETELASSTNSVYVVDASYVPDGLMSSNLGYAPDGTVVTLTRTDAVVNTRCEFFSNSANLVFRKTGTSYLNLDAGETIVLQQRGGVAGVWETLADSTVLSFSSNMTVGPMPFSVTNAGIQKAELLVGVSIVDSATGTPKGTWSNAVSGDVFPMSVPGNVDDVTSNFWNIGTIGVTDVVTFADVSTGTGTSFTVYKAVLRFK